MESFITYLFSLLKIRAKRYQDQLVAARLECVGFSRA